MVQYTIQYQTFICLVQYNLSTIKISFTYLKHANTLGMNAFSVNKYNKLLELQHNITELILISSLILSSVFVLISSILLFTICLSIAKQLSDDLQFSFQSTCTVKSKNDLHLSFRFILKKHIIPYFSPTSSDSTCDTTCRTVLASYTSLDKQTLTPCAWLYRLRTGGRVDYLCRICSNTKYNPTTASI